LTSSETALIPSLEVEPGPKYFIPTNKFGHELIYYAESKRRRRVANFISRRPEITDVPNHLLGRRSGRYFTHAEIWISGGTGFCDCVAPIVSRDQPPD